MDDERVAILPDEYMIEVHDGKRMLCENTPVFQLTTDGLGRVEHHNRRVALFHDKPSVSQVEAIAWDDYSSRHTYDSLIRKQCLYRLKEAFSQRR